MTLRFYWVHTGQPQTGNSLKLEIYSRPCPDCLSVLHQERAVVDRDLVVTGCPTGIVQQLVRVYDDWCGDAAVLHRTGRHDGLLVVCETIQATQMKLPSAWPVKKRLSQGAVSVLQVG